MTNIPLDQNSRAGLAAISSTDGSIVPLYADPTTHRLLVDMTGTVALNSIINTTGGTTVLTSAQNNSTSIEVTGVLTSNATIIVADLKAPFAVENLTTGAFTLTFKTAAGTGVVVNQGTTIMLYANGTNAEVAISTGGGSVTSVSVVTANGVSGSVATATTTPAITLTLGAITPSSVTTPIIKPSADSTTAVQINKADGTTNVVNVDTTNGRVGIGTTAPAYKLDVNGDTNVAAGSAYKYNGANMAMASTTLFNYFLGGAGNLTMTGTYNTGTGYQALKSNTTGNYNTANGVNSLYSNTTGTSNIANGQSSLYSNTTGIQNTANGQSSLYSNTTGNYNTANGQASLQANTTGNFNTANGYASLYFNTTGTGNLAQGFQAGYGDGTTVDQRSVIDNYATFLGYQASRDASVASTTVLTNITAIGKNARVGASNTIVLGGTGADAVNVGIGTVAPTAPLHVNYTDTSSSLNTHYGVQISPTYNQTGTAGATDLLINRTQTAVGSGAQLLIDAQVGGVSKFKVDNSGQLDMTGSIKLSAGFYGSNLYSATGTAPLSIYGRYTNSTAGNAVNLSTTFFPWTNSSGLANPVSITSVINQTGTAGATDLLINRTQTAVGSGAQLLIDAQVGGVSKASIDNLGNSYATHMSAGYRTQATAASTLALTLGDAEFQIFTGTTASQVVTLPNVTTGATAGYRFYIDNDSTQSITIQASDASALVTLLSKQSVELTMISAGATNASWDVSVVAGLDAANVWSAAQQFSTVELGHATDTTLSRVSAGVIAVEGVTLATSSNTLTLTNKRNTLRTVTVNAPGATPTTNTDNQDVAVFTGLNAAITSMTTNLSGTPVANDLLEFIFVDDGTARAITWGASFADSGTVLLPTTTVISVPKRVIVQYQTIASLNKWVCVANV